MYFVITLEYFWTVGGQAEIINLYEIFISFGVCSISDKLYNYKSIKRLQPVLRSGEIKNEITRGGACIIPRTNSNLMRRK